MKVAKLHDGKVLKFPDETPDEAIDHTVRVHLDNHRKKAQEEENKNQQIRNEQDQKHNSLLHGLHVIAQMLQQMTHDNQAFAHLFSAQLEELIKAQKELIRVQMLPRKAIINKEGRTTGSKVEE